jgi:hypothetical protein
MVAAGVSVLAACEEDRSYVTTPIGPPSYDFRTFTANGLVPGGSVSAVEPDTVVFTLRNVPNLSGSTYAFWASDTSGAGNVKLTGNVLEIFLRDSLDAGGNPVRDPLTDEVIQVRDTNVVPSVDSYAGPTDDAVFQVVARMAAPGAAYLNSGVVSLDASGNDRFLWFRREVEGTTATGTLTITSALNALDGETVTIGGKVYTFQLVLTNADGNVQIGVNRDSTCLNLARAVTRTGTPGTHYAAATTAHTQVTAARSGGTVVVTTRTAGHNRGIATTETMTNGSWGATTLRGGGAGNLYFGNFGGAAGQGTFVTDTIPSAADDDFLFTIISSRLVGGFRGDEVVLELQGIGRPPAGFLYRGYLVDDDGVATMVDNLRSPYPERADYSDADTDDAKVVVGFDPRRDQVISWGQIRNCVQGSNVAGTCTLSIAGSTADSSAFRGFAQFVVTLDPKAGAAAGLRNIIWSAVVPDAVRKGTGVYQ